MNGAQWLLDLQTNLATRAVGHSSLRGTPKGTVARTRSYLAKLNLQCLGNVVYRDWLDRRTEELLQTSEGQAWGTARKSLNLLSLIHI